MNNDYDILLLPRARGARTRGRVIGLSVGGFCLFVDKKMSTLSETEIEKILLLHGSQTRAYFKKPKKADF